MLYKNGNGRFFFDERFSEKGDLIGENSAKPRTF